MKKAIIILLSIIITSFSQVQNFKDENRRNSIYLSFGYDESLTTLTLGYVRGIIFKENLSRLILHTDYSVPVIKFDLNDFRFRVGTQYSLLKKGYFDIPVRFNILFNGTENKSFNAVGFGTELGFLPGFYRSSFFVCLDIYWIQQWTSYLKHTDLYKKYFYENVKDGWYKTPSASMRYGLNIGCYIKKRFQISLKGGFQHFGEYNDNAPKIYGILGTALFL